MTTNGLNGKQYEESHITSETGNPLTKYVNLCQSAEERRDKYKFCRFYRLPVTWAQRARDWHWTKINLLSEAWRNPAQSEFWPKGGTDE